MKKVLLSLLGLTCFTLITNAQGLNIGAKAGANLTKISGESFKNGFELSYQVGGFIEYDFSKTWGIQPEVLFGQTKSKTASGFDAVYGNITTKQAKLDYLSIPILLRWNVIPKLLTINAGPQVGILLNGEKSLFNNGTDAFKSGDFSVVAGAQVNLKSFRVYGRYNIGLSNIKDLSGGSEKWRNQAIQLGLGFVIL